MRRTILSQPMRLSVPLALAATSLSFAARSESAQLPELRPGMLLKYELSSGGTVDEILPLQFLGRRGPWQIFQGRDLNDDVYFYAEAALGLVFSDCLDPEIPSDADIAAFSDKLRTWPVGEVINIPSAASTEYVTVSPEGVTTASGLSERPITSRKLSLYEQFSDEKTVYVVPEHGEVVLNIEWGDGSLDRLIEIAQPGPDFGTAPDASALRQICPAIFASK